MTQAATAPTAISPPAAASPLPLPKPALKRAKTPTILQMEAVECGAASLAMVLAYHGRWIPLEELRNESGVSRNGSKASNILKCARRHGMSARGFNKNDPAALQSLPVPSIIHWNFNHFLVYEGVRDGVVFLNDPASGPRQVSLQDLADCFTGVVLVFEPGPDFAKCGRPPSLLAELATRLQFSHAALVFVALASLLLVVPGVLVPVFSKVFVDAVLIGGQQDWFRPLILAMVLTVLVRGFLVWVQQRYLLKLELKLALSMSSSFLAHVLKLPMSFFTQRQAGDVANRIAASERIAKLLSGELATNFFNLITVFFYALVMLFFNLKLALIGIGLVSLNFVMLHNMARTRADASGRMVNDLGKLGGATVGAIRGIETLKASGTERTAFATWAGYQASALGAQQTLGGQTVWQSAMPSMLGALTVVAVLGLGGYQVMRGDMTVGDLIAFQLLMAGFTLPVGRLVGLVGNLQTIKGLLVRLSDVFRYPLPASADSHDAHDLQAAASLQGQLELRDVSFGYSPLDAPLINQLSLKVRPGARIALVGGSGSGKSTVGRLACGLLEPTAGQVLLDGKPLAQVPNRVFAMAAAYVDQDVFLFEGTVRDNLSLWDVGLPEPAMQRALNDAMIAPEIVQRRAGLDALVNEGGTNFSGGERQRLEIARALVRDPLLLVLDEATSALDTVTEKAIDDNLRRRGCACIIIAHRLSTIRDCDEILVMKYGKVVERGTHDTLLALQGEYASLVKTM
ncbi:NHLP family bacteriocin export ABC transporter peptidase/permease/ATPase subunit [Rhodoferax sp.]|uniref:NHLP family bacteriocin export ABC transporter peptidase/permease/ATPase subunit n=1 Tax=Rhodoferax sp. TaxID=50421 RepID=UPI002722A123|nr:NHLP family bacteriocin export ABC transporter peptidase/permease/ATPase subunit [Rhodoferax sp.]MDO8320838.1 NHLP family bacteriocin export ABC transporter peptidase/permease/ATPase subunit [Rhodoferax sp.]